jgi:Fur family transcriptional regulator, ferric uptake regulator
MSCLATLKEKGLKLTPQRILIADIIHDAKGHITAEDIIEHVQAKMPGVNKSTIYRTLDILEEADCVYKSEMGNETVYHHNDEGHHHHLMCSKCGKTINCDEDIFTPLTRSLMKKYNFHVDFKHIVMNGICEDCRNKSN